LLPETISWTNGEWNYMFRFDKVPVAVQMPLGFKLIWFIPELGVIVNSPQVWSNLLYITMLVEDIRTISDTHKMQV